jgi:hypothetical protein
MRKVAVEVQGNELQQRVAGLMPTGLGFSEKPRTKRKETYSKDETERRRKGEVGTKGTWEMI